MSSRLTKLRKWKPKGKAFMDEHEKNDKLKLGFWVYLMTDLIMFAVLFAAFAVLRGNTFGGASAKELLSLPGALANTLILLTSSFTCGLAILAVAKKDKIGTQISLGVTFVLGLTFLILELNEFSKRTTVRYMSNGIHAVLIEFILVRVEAR